MNKNDVSCPSLRNSVILLLLLAGLLPFLVSLAARILFGTVPYEDFSIHEFFELTGSCIGMAMAMLLLMRSRVDENSSYLIWAACALLCMGLIDLIHGVMPYGPVWSWLRHGGTFFGGIIFACLWFRIPYVAANRGKYMILGFILFALLFSFSSVYWSPLLPMPISPEGYHPLVKVINITGGLGFLVASLFFIVRYLRNPVNEELYFAGLTLLFGISGVLFGFSRVWSADWWVWHLFRMLAYSILLVSGYRMITAMNRDLQHSRDNLENLVEKRTRELQHLNDASFVSRERILKVFDESPLGMAYSNLDFGFIEVNNVFCRMMGYSRDELLRLTFRDISHKDHLSEDIRSIDKLLMGEITVYKTEKRYTRKDHKVIWGYLNLTVIKDPDGRNIHFLAMLEDITVRKEAEDNLKSAEEKFRNLFEKSPLGISLTGVDGTLNLNKAFIEITGYSEAELKGKKWMEISHPDDLELTDGLVNSLLEGKSNSFRLNKRYIHKNGGIIWADVSTTLFRDKNNEPQFFITIINNITEQRKIEAAGLRRENLLRSVLESAGAGILVVDEERKITHSNSLFGKMWGIPEKLMEDGSDQKLMANVLDQLSDPQLFIEKVEKLYKSSVVDTDILHFKDGRIFERLSYPLVMETKIKGRVWSFRDVTRLKNVENELKRVNDELVELNATKDKFFSIIAHDLRSPFNVLLGLSRILADPEEKLSLEDTRKFAGRIHATLTSQFELLQNLLEWARLQLHKVEYHPDMVNIYQTVSNITELLSGNLLRKNIVFENDLDESLSAFVDPNVLVSVLNNIISNAIKFTRSKGTILVSGKRTNNHLELVVRDNGVGMNRERIQQIFRLDSVSSTRGTDGERGTGLGLILCKELLEKQGGSMQISSEENIGTTVTIILPYGNTVTRTDR